MKQQTHRKGTLKGLSFLVLVCCIFLSLDIQAQKSKRADDIEAIKAMEGCYEVEFKYTETFSPEIDYEQAYDYTSAALEWAQVIEETKDYISIQHLLIVYDTVVIKHWRQDWTYQDDRSFTYDKDNTWKFFDLDSDETKGKWTQEVYQVDDSPRYAGTATWTHVDGKSEWHNVADSPLPRREYSKRSDYNLMKRGNRVHITENGWLHEQDNDKVIREHGKADQLLVQEKGYNTYKRIDSEKCKLARDWWEEHAEMWSHVRDAWADTYASNDVLKLHVKVDDKRMYEHLFYGQQAWNDEEIEELITEYTDEMRDL